MTIFHAVKTQPAIVCPSWCARTDHDADVVDQQNPEHHYGPDFGVFSVEALGDGKPYVLAYQRLVDATASDLRQLAVNAVAAAEWLEAHS